MHWTKGEGRGGGGETQLQLPAAIGRLYRDSRNNLYEAEGDMKQDGQ